MDTRHRHQHHVPTGPLIGAGALALVSLLSVAWIRWAEQGPGQAGQVVDPQPKVAVVESRELLFSDTADGGVEVVDGQTGEWITTLPAGEHGFIRASLRGLARSRRELGADRFTPFRLDLLADNRLLLVDPVNGQEVDLWAFGATNAGAFLALLQAGANQAADSQARVNQSALSSSTALSSTTLDNRQVSPAGDTP